MTIFFTGKILLFGTDFSSCKVPFSLFIGMSSLYDLFTIILFYQHAMRCLADRFVTLFTCVTLDSEVLLFKLSLLDLDLDKCITLYAIHVTHTSYAIVVLASLEPDATKVLMDNRVCIALKLSTPFNLRCKLKFMSQ